LGVFTAPGLTDFLLGTKASFDGHLDLANAPRASDTLKPENNELIVFVTADVYKKEALEYRVIRDGKVIRDWGHNEFDNNAIRLKDLEPGKYALELRYRRQRQSVTTYTFWKSPYWYQRGWIRLAAVSLVVAFGVLLARLLVLRRQKMELTESNRKMSAIASELRYVQSQLNPHFIFNALSSIQGLINSGDISRANEYLAEFSSLLRETLAGDEKGMAPLAVELKMLQRYLKLEQLRFNFASEVSLDDAVKENEVTFPVLLLQPLVENAVKHGVAGMEGRGKIGVCIRAANGDMEVEVRDNGRGFEVGAGSTGANDPGGRMGFAGAPAGAGLGLRLTRDRIQLINRSNPRQPVDMRIESRPGKGTLVFFRFKNWLK
jgi:signal transduction histidine kinase